MKKVQILELFPDKVKVMGTWIKCEKQLQKEIDNGWKIESTTCTPKGTCIVFLTKDESVNMLND